MTSMQRIKWTAGEVINILIMSTVSRSTGIVMHFMPLSEENGGNIKHSRGSSTEALLTPAFMYSGCS